MIRLNEDFNLDSILEEAKWEQSGNFEKLRRGGHPIFPTSSDQKKSRSSHQTYASRRTKRRISKERTGMHRRRQRRVT